MRLTRAPYVSFVVCGVRNRRRRISAIIVIAKGNLWGDPGTGCRDRKFNRGRSSIRRTYGAIADHARTGGRPAACPPPLGCASWAVSLATAGGAQYRGDRIAGSGLRKEALVVTRGRTPRLVRTGHSCALAPSLATATVGEHPTGMGLPRWTPCPARRRWPDPRCSPTSCSSP